MGLVSCKESSEPENRELSPGEGPELLCELALYADCPSTTLLFSSTNGHHWIQDPGTATPVSVFPVTKDRGREWQPETGCEGSGAGGRT